MFVRRFIDFLVREEPSRVPSHNSAVYWPGNKLPVSHFKDPLKRKLLSRISRDCFNFDRDVG